MRSIWPRLRRSSRVALTAAQIYWGYKRTQRRVRRLAPGSDGGTDWDVQHERAARALYQLAIELKGVHIKAGQFIGTRADLVPEQYVQWLGRLQDRVPPRPAPDVRTDVEAAFGRPLRELFSDFDDEPLAAASLAQVHRARLPDGRDVAVKVRHPDIERLVTIDFRNLRSVVRLVAWREPGFDYRAVVEELEREMPRELDFVREARMLQRVAADLADLEEVVLPEVVDDLLAPTVLVTTFIEGARILDRETIESWGVQPRRLVELLALAYGRQILEHGVFQADPHPGNILVLRDGRIALLDFGLTKQLPEPVRFGFARLVASGAKHDPQGVTAAFRELGIETALDDPESLVELTSLLLDPRPLGDGERQAVGRSRRALSYNPVHAIPSYARLITHQRITSAGQPIKQS